MKREFNFRVGMVLLAMTMNLFAEDAIPANEKSAINSTNTVMEISWQELIPKDLTREKMRKGKSIDEEKQFGIVYDINVFKPRPELDGQLIRIGGFTLPLEMDGEKATEFLLVPFVGACIHVPPPPPIQIIYVTFPEGYKSRVLYDAVWVTGRLATKNANYNLDFVDGNEDIQVGYSLNAVTVAALPLGSVRRKQ